MQRVTVQGVKLEFCGCEVDVSGRDHVLWARRTRLGLRHGHRVVTRMVMLVIHPVAVPAGHGRRARTAYTHVRDSGSAQDLVRTCSLLLRALARRHVRRDRMGLRVRRIAPVIRGR